MTTTPTGSPELPELDHLEALARAATPGPWAYQEDSDAYTHIVRPVSSPGWIIASATQTSKPEGEANGRWIAAANPAAVLALIEMARRAQPEGEAPQAEQTVRVFPDEVVSTASEVAWCICLPDGRVELSNVFTDFAEATEYLTERAIDGCALRGLKFASTAQPALAAQSQGAQAGSLGALIVEMEAAGATGWAYRLTQVIAAQQAAAPGALTLLNADELAALHRFQETCQDFDSGGYDVDKNMMKRLASIGVIESKGFNRYQFTEFGDYVVENQAPSAPGTPEAPADDHKGIALWNATMRACGELPEGYEVRIELESGCGMAVWYDAEGERHVIDGDGYLSDDVNEAVDAAIARAAQLDGGQGEDAS